MKMKEMKWVTTISDRKEWPKAHKTLGYMVCVTLNPAIASPWMHSEILISQCCWFISASGARSRRTNHIKLIEFTLLFYARIKPIVKYSVLISFRFMHAMEKMTILLVHRQRAKERFTSKLIINSMRDELASCVRTTKRINSNLIHISVS